MDYQTALNSKIDLELRQDIASKRLNAFPKGNMGLTPDHIRLSSDYQSARQNYASITKELQKFNQFFVKAFKKEYRATIEQNRAAKAEKK